MPSPQAAAENAERSDAGLLNVADVFAMRNRSAFSPPESRDAMNLRLRLAALAGDDTIFDVSGRRLCAATGLGHPFRRCARRSRHGVSVYSKPRCLRHGEIWSSGFLFYRSLSVGAEPP